MTQLYSPAVLHTTLTNGLQVVLKEVHSAPIVSWYVTYRVGSRNERTGQTGISHWVEHMLFKGTPRFPAGTLDKTMDRLGGDWNGATSQDSTTFHETLPAQHIGLALEVEADRMVNAQFLPEEVEKERTVIISERRGRESNPSFWLMEEVQGVAFRVHGYRHQIVGELCDLQRITRDELYQHYRLHYRPSNAAVVAVGAFDSQRLLEQIEQLYGNLPAEPAPVLFNRPEPEQLGERRVVVERPAESRSILMVHRVPEALHPDWVKLFMLDVILSGTSLGGHTSRLYQALVKTGLCMSVASTLQQTIDPYLHTILLMLNDDVEHAQAERAVIEVIERLQQEPVSEVELRRAVKQMRAQQAYASETVDNQASMLAAEAILGQIGWNEQVLDQLERVTPEDILDVARRYLIPRSRTVGWLIPTGEAQ